MRKTLDELYNIRKRQIKSCMRETLFHGLGLFAEEYYPTNRFYTRVIPHFVVKKNRKTTLEKFEIYYRIFSTRICNYQHLLLSVLHLLIYKKLYNFLEIIHHLVSIAQS